MFAVVVKTEEVLLLQQVCLGEIYHCVETNASSADIDFQNLRKKFYALAAGRIFALRELLVDDRT